MSNVEVSIAFVIPCFNDSELFTCQFFSCGSTAQFWALASSMKLSVPFRLLDLRVVGEEISKYKLDLVGVQEVRWDGGGTERAGEYTFFYGSNGGE
jgi:hypothetical protein